MTNITKRQNKVLEFQLLGYSKTAANTLLRLCDDVIDNPLEKNLAFRECFGKKKLYHNITDGQLFWLYPLNGRYDIYLADRLTIRYMLQGYNSVMPAYYFLLQRREGKTIPIGLLDLDKGYEATYDGVLKLIRDKKNLALINSNTAMSMKKRVLRYKEDKYYFRGKEIDKDDLIKLLSEEKGSLLIENIRADSKSRAMFDGSSPSVNLQTLYGNTVAIYITVPGGDDIQKNNVLRRHYEEKEYLTEEEKKELYGIANKLKNFFPEAEYLNYEFIKTNKGFKMVAVNSGWELAEVPDIHKEIRKYLAGKTKAKKNALIKEKIDKDELERMREIENTGFNYRAYESWLRGLEDDCSSVFTTAEEKAWAHQRGFYSHRVHQFDLSDDNIDDYIPDFTYKWLRNINSKYRKWIGDKMLTRYIFENFSEFIPKLYYSLITYGEVLMVNSKQDLPEHIEDNAEGIIKLLEAKNKLALKPVVGSRGHGFYRMKYDKGRYFLNDESYDKAELINRLNSLKEDYIITEYVKQCDFLNNIYPESVSTVRLMVINKDGKSPEIMDAYIRLGCESSGYTDNISRGGLAAMVDINTGELFEPMSFVNAIYRDCPVHPDTGANIKGRLPNWEKNKKALLEMMRFLSPIEYMGVDMAITEEGFKILEINRHQDLHRYQNYSEAVHDYLTGKINDKKKRYDIPFELIGKELKGKTYETIK